MAAVWVMVRLLVSLASAVLYSQGINLSITPNHGGVLHVQSNDSVHLKCTLTGLTPGVSAELQWSLFPAADMDESVIQEEQPESHSLVLTIPSAQLRHAGQYVCMSHMYPERKKIRLEVDYDKYNVGGRKKIKEKTTAGDEWGLTLSPTRLILALRGSTISVNCSLPELATFDLRWFYDDSMQQRVQIRRIKTNILQLTLHKVREEDQSQLTCRSDYYGTRSVSLLLIDYTSVKNRIGLKVSVSTENSRSAIPGQETDHTMTWLMSTIYSVMGVTVGLVCLLAIMVIIMCRIRIKRQAIRSWSHRPHSPSHGRRHRRPLWQFSTPFNLRPDFVEYIPSNRNARLRNMSLNINLQLEDDGDIPMDIFMAPPPYTEDVRSVPLDDVAPPPYSTLDRPVRRPRMNQSQTNDNNNVCSSVNGPNLSRGDETGTSANERRGNNSEENGPVCDRQRYDLPEGDTSQSQLGSRAASHHSLRADTQLHQTNLNQPIGNTLSTDFPQNRPIADNLASVIRYDLLNSSPEAGADSDSHPEPGEQINSPDTQGNPCVNSEPDSTSEVTNVEVETSNRRTIIERSSGSDCLPLRLTNEGRAPCPTATDELHQPLLPEDLTHTSR